MRPVAQVVRRERRHARRGAEAIRAEALEHAPFRGTILARHELLDGLEDGRRHGDREAGLVCTQGGGERCDGRFEPGSMRTRSHGSSRASLPAACGARARP